MNQAPPPTPATAVAVNSSARLDAATTRGGKTKVNSKRAKSDDLKGENRAARIGTPTRSARLLIKANGKGKQESWVVATTTKPATKGSRQTSFRVRVSDVGYRVCLVYYDEAGIRREPYLCYLSAKEWQQVKRGSLAQFAQIMLDKLIERAAKEGADSEKLDGLSRRVKGFL